MHKFPNALAELTDFLKVFFYYLIFEKKTDLINLNIFIMSCLIMPTDCKS